MKGGVAGGITLLVLALLVAMSLVPWRQSRALEVLAELDRVERELALVRAEKHRFQAKVDRLESREHVQVEARDRLGLRMPEASEVVILDLDAREAGEPEDLIPEPPDEEGTP